MFGEGIRHKWEFAFPIYEVLSAIEQKLNWHSERLEYWRQELKDAEGTQVKAQQERQIEDDPELPDAINMSYASNMSSVRDLNEQRITHAKVKVGEHGRYVAEFERYQRALTRYRGGAINLTIPDMEHFGL